MSLLDELARNSYNVDFDFQELLSQSPTNSPSKEYSRDITIVTSTCPLSIELLEAQPLSNKSISISSSLNAVATGQESEYYQSYRKKVTKMNRLVSLLSAKTRKIMYQFFVRLERYTKSSETKPQKMPQKIQNKQPVPKTFKTNKFNETLLFSSLEPLVKIINGKEKTLVREAFKKIHKKMRNIMKSEYIGNCLQNIQSHRRQVFLRHVFAVMKVWTQKQVKTKEVPTLGKSIFLPRLGKSAKVRTNLHLQPLNCCYLIEPAQPPKLGSLYPQKPEQQNKDYCDTMTLFMNRQQNSTSIINSRIDDSFGGKDCISAYFDKNTLSPRSYVKNLSQIELTSIPQSALEKRRVSDFTVSAGDSLTGNYSHVQERNQLTNGMNPTRSEVALHNESLNNNVFPEEKDEYYQSPKQRKVFDPFSNFIQRQSQTKEEKEPIIRSQSEFKICRTERKNTAGIQEEIEMCYHEEMNRYMKFKRSLLERRRSTLKQIEKSQEVIKKLMQKYDDSKDKSAKPKVTLKNPKTREGSFKNSSKTSQASSKKTTPAKRSPRRSKIQQNIQEMSFLLRDNEQEKIMTLEQYQKHEIDPKIESPRNMDVFFSYVSEKKRMLPEKSPSSKKNSKNKTNQSSTSKKTDKKTATPAARKSILALSNFPAAKEQRLDLKLDLTRDSGKKVHPSNMGRESLKSGTGPAYKQKLKAHKK